MLKHSAPILCGLILCLLLQPGVNAQGQDPAAAPETRADDVAVNAAAETAADQDSKGGESSSAATREEPRVRLEVSLDDCLRLALLHNLGIRVERLNYDKSNRDVALARAAFDPIFTTTYTMSKFRSPTVDFLSGLTTTSSVAVNPFTNQSFEFGFNGLLPIGTQYSITGGNNRGDNPESAFFALNPRNNTSLTLRVTQPVLKGFGQDNNLADLRISANSALSARLGFGRLQETTLGNIHTAYWNLVFNQEDLQVKLQSLEEAQALLRINRNKVAVGTAKKIDIITAEAEIETQRSGIIDSENTLRKAQEDLLDAMNYVEVLRAQGEIEEGGPLYDGIEVVPTSELDFVAYPVNLREAIQTALERRADLAQSQVALDSAKLELARNENLFLPTFNVQGTWTQNGLEENLGNSADELFSGRFYDWSLGFTFEYPLGNRSAEAQRQRARADLEIAELNLQTTRNSIILEITQLVRDIESRAQQVATNQAVARLRREQFTGEQKRLEVGSSTSYQVQQIQNDLLEAESLSIRALADYKLAITAFELAAGIILEDLQIAEAPEPAK